MYGIYGTFLGGAYDGERQSLEALAVLWDARDLREALETMTAPGGGFGRDKRPTPKQIDLAVTKARAVRELSDAGSAGRRCAFCAGTGWAWVVEGYEDAFGNGRRVMRRPELEWAPVLRTAYAACACSVGDLRVATGEDGKAGARYASVYLMDMHGALAYMDRAEREIGDAAMPALLRERLELVTGKRGQMRARLALATGAELAQIRAACEYLDGEAARLEGELGRMGRPMAEPDPAWEAAIARIVTLNAVNALLAEALRGRGERQRRWTAATLARLTEGRTAGDAQWDGDAQRWESAVGATGERDGSRDGRTNERADGAASGQRGANGEEVG